MTIVLTCERCRCEHEPNRADIIKGPQWYRFCAACREPLRAAAPSGAHVHLEGIKDDVEAPVVS